MHFQHAENMHFLEIKGILLSSARMDIISLFFGNTHLELRKSLELWGPYKWPNIHGFAWG